MPVGVSTGFFTSMSHPSPSFYRPDIDGLRGLAVLMVVLFHAGLGFKGGYVGVDLFFVISGYLITGLLFKELDRGGIDLAGFWERRLRRIAPALGVMLLVTLAVAVIHEQRGEIFVGVECLEATEDRVRLSFTVRDTGIGIPKNQLDKIFDRFYQVDGSHTRMYGGSGIGLSLTKELIALHKGRIEVESEEGKGTTFRLLFPLGKSHLSKEEICEEEKCGKVDQDKDEDKDKDELSLLLEQRIRSKNFASENYEIEAVPTLLIVEDNPDVRKYISMILENQYSIIEAADGEEGLNKSFECIPNIIISDIMMPKMDGFVMCYKLKTDSRTSHIPIIMLTAKATIENKISGLEIGADDYIIKPFEADELKARIKNLLEQRKRLHEHFRQHGLLELDEKNITPIDKKFLEKCIEVINKHIADTSFGVEVLAENMLVSRSVLLKKIEALIGESPIELIKRIRLHSAAKLIEKNFGNVSQIALEVGFNNPSYFAECFKKQFGVSPSQFHSSNKKYR